LTLATLDMAFQIPPWLQTNPLAAISEAAALGNRIREQNVQQFLAQQEMAQRASQFQAQQADRAAALQLEAEGQRQQQALRQQQFALDQAQAAEKAKAAARYNIGLTNFQNAVAGGQDPMQALINNLGDLAATNPNAIESVLGKKMAADISKQNAEIRNQYLVDKLIQDKTIAEAKQASLDAYRAAREEDRRRDADRLEKLSKSHTLTDLEKLQLGAGIKGAWDEAMAMPTAENFAKARERINAMFAPFEARKSAAPAPKTSDIPTITNDDEYDNLPSGTQFYGPDGKLRRKP